MKKPYSVIIPSHRRPKLLRRALNSLYAQTLPPAELLLVIDEPENWEKYGFLRGYDERLKISFTGGGRGGAGARNVGLERVSTEYVFFLDDDDEWLPEKAERQIAFLAGAGETMVGVSCHRIRRTPQGDLNVCPGQDDVNRYGRMINLIGSFSLFGMNWNNRTKHIRIDEDLQCAQDLDFYIKAMQFGQIGILQEVLAVYHSHTGERISGKYRAKLNATKRLLNNHRRTLSLRERCWYRARRAAYAAMVSSNGKEGFMHLIELLCCGVPFIGIPVARKNLRFWLSHIRMAWRRRCVEDSSF